MDSVFDYIWKLLDQIDERSGNYVEALLWFSFCATFLVSLAWPGFRKDKLAAAIVFAAFAASDLMEMQTGAWYEPWWLAAWKGTCVILMAWLLFRYTARSKAAKRAKGK